LRSVSESDTEITHDRHGCILNPVDEMGATGEISTLSSTTTVTLAFGERCRYLTATSVLHTNNS
jgi:hypothetical protein